MNLKNSGDSTGFEAMTSAMPVQCSNQLSYEVTHSGVQVNSLSSCFLVKECHMKEGCSHASINTVIRNELLEAQMFAID